ncbi:MAG TPA: phosphotransferase family protein [Beijerinckiaceae bacterium]|nr:phosphotransferase family protein [Beijerinckiaceae bacterium]
MNAATDFDDTPLRAFLMSRFGETPSFRLERIAGGQSNPTYFVDHGEHRFVLRKQPDGPLLRGAHAIDREYRVLTALNPTGVPVPRPILFHEAPDIVGTPFYLMERVEGRIFASGALPEAAPGERNALWMGLAKALAHLHALRPDEVGLGDFGRPGNYFERQLARWSRQWHESSSQPIPELDALAAWLADHLPADDGAVSIAHGDYRMGNVIFHPTEPRVVAILDWELATLGHPLADVGFCAMAWHTAPEEYGGILGLDLAACGLPTQEQFVSCYARANPSVAELQPFHLAFALFRFAVIFVGIADRARQGTAAGTDARSIGPLARRFAVRALEVISGKH